MSSMFKKKGGPAFKPKIPAARRPAAPAPSQPPKAPPAASPPQVSNVPEPQDTPQEPVEYSSPKDPVTVTAELHSEDSRELGRQPPTPPSTLPEPPKPDEPAVTEESAQEKSPEGIQLPTEDQNIEPQPEQNVVSAATKVGTKPGTTQTQPTSEQEHNRSSIVEEPNEAQSSGSEDSPSPVLQTPTPDDSEGPSGTDSSTTPSLPTSDLNESHEKTSDEAQNTSKLARKLRTRKQTAQATQDEAGTEEGSRAKKRQRKTAEEGATPKQPRKRRVTQSGTSTPRNRRARSITPEDSESQLVDLQKLKMADLTKDLHIGKKFSRHDELRERERRARMKSKLGTDGERDSSATPEASGQGEKIGSPAAPSPAPSASTPAAPSGPQFRIVDGQIVIDQSSLAVDRHARAAAAAGDMETVEENDFTRLITSNSFMNTSKLKGPNIWTDAETELFYRGLRMLGTDFEMISKMFPGKQRRHVKLKFNREERHCPQRINAALIGEKTVKIDIDEYKAFTGSEFEPVADIEAEQRRIQEEYEAEEKRRADEQAEIMRKRREELFKDDDEGDAKKKKKKKKQTVVYGLNGEPIAQEA
ncbi:Transcription factor TFIIIB component B'' [Fusarium austroafricanum]|uniref:Transcription factor TFIIIB component B n=1 Tax=Fusarium austroafricanum TaxID=2364996 RepID=A0A8H4KLY4_9HYPO|nr:Transcription factor TFIIIB component B'' [Fusarium austroafricanum]